MSDRIDPLTGDTISSENQQAEEGQEEDDQHVYVAASEGAARPGVPRQTDREKVESLQEHGEEVFEKLRPSGVPSQGVYEKVGSL
ncbi:hypothetical protein SBDP1_1730001 [Syntrophobacter sp. SbD1]|nr:hypothetical protein SBDP1_1730001 [Syntrophobacter sp. SbD1]